MRERGNYRSFVCELLGIRGWAKILEAQDTRTLQSRRFLLASMKFDVNDMGVTVTDEKAVLSHGQPVSVV